MEDLVKEFIAETNDSLMEIDLDLVKLEQDPTNKELLGKIFRLMHTIKGTCGFINLPRLEKVAHVCENLLDDFRSDKITITEELMTTLFMSIDRVRFLVSEVEKTGAEPSGEDGDIIDIIKQSQEKAYENGNNPALEEGNNTVEIPDNQAVDAKVIEVKSKEPEIKAVKSDDADIKKSDIAEKNPEFLRVQMNVLEDLINMVSELVLTRNQLLQLTRLEENSLLNTPLQRLNRIVSDLQDNVMKTRMQPIGNAWSKLPRIVRDLAAETKKKISLEMKGEETELDRQVLELIKDPLTHMIRNSCDHGIESPSERLENNKSETGLIKLHAFHEGGFIVIEISDDGKGLDPEKIAEKAVSKNLIEADIVEKMSEKQILDLIMRPGFSTAEAITNISGRGVGMDVVRANIEKIGGSIDMESTVGNGTKFTIQIPLTLAIISALIVEIDNNRYAIPQMNIQELVSLGNAGKEMIEYINHKPVLRLRDRIIPLLKSGVLLNSKEDDIDDSKKSIAIITAGSTCYGIIIDHIFDTEEVVIKSVSSVLKSADIFSGNTILGNGEVIMILDPVAIARRFNVEKEATNLDIQNNINTAETKHKAETASMLIFKAGKGIEKAIPLAMVHRLQVFDSQRISHSADKMIVQNNGKLVQLLFVDPDSQKLSDKEVTSLMLSDDRSDSSIGLVIDQVIDIVEGELELAESTNRGGILGSMILGGCTVDIIDIAYYLEENSSDWFSQKTHSQKPFVHKHLKNVQSKERNRNPEPQNSEYHIMTAKNVSQNYSVSGKASILVVDDSSFFRNMLHPILKTAGYDVTLAEDAIEAIKLHDAGYQFDIILSDIEMPGMDGYEFVEKMRSNSTWKDLPFIALTSHNTPLDIEYGYKKGFNQYIGKFDKDILINSLAEVG